MQDVAGIVDSGTAAGGPGIQTLREEAKRVATGDAPNEAKLDLSRLGWLLIPLSNYECPLTGVHLAGVAVTSADGEWSTRKCTRAVACVRNEANSSFGDVGSAELRKAGIVDLTVLESVSRRLLTLVQLTRMALVFTAISNSLCALMLWSRWNTADGQSIRAVLTWPHAICVAGVSVGLYGFGMSLNDIIDRRRDSQIAADRPLPSGRIGVGAAHAVCFSLATLALICGSAVTRFENGDWLSLLLVVWTGVLIAFYDFAGKYLVAPGLLTLGLIRFFHAAIAAPRLPLLWHPLLLLNHVTLLSAVAYSWEAKRPTLTRLHWFGVFAGLGSIDVLCIALVGMRRQSKMGGGMREALWITPWLIVPAVATLLFVALAFRIRRQFGSAKIGETAVSDEPETGSSPGNLRRAGQTLMLYGLLWLIVYDAAFGFAYVSWMAGLALILLLPLAYLSVKLTRWWAKVLSLSQRLEYQRVR